MEEFKNIFEGLDVAYGQHQSEGKRADGKQEGKSYIVKKVVEESNNLYESMLDKTTESLEKILLNTESISKIQ